MIHELQGEWVAARDDYDRVVQILNAPEDIATAYAAWVGRARAEAKLGRRETVRELLEGAIEIDNQALWAYLEMAHLYGEDEEEADGWLNKARQVPASEYYPGNRNLQLAIGDICRARQDFTCADEAYQQALAASPPSGWLHARLGDYYRHKERPALALAQYEKAAELRPRDPQAYATLGYMWAISQDYQEAGEAYRQAIVLSYPGDDVTIEAYCMALAQIVEAGELDRRLAQVEHC